MNTAYFRFIIVHCDNSVFTDAEVALSVTSSSNSLSVCQSVWAKSNLADLNLFSTETYIPAAANHRGWIVLTSAILTIKYLKTDSCSVFLLPSWLCLWRLSKKWILSPKKSLPRFEYYEKTLPRKISLNSSGLFTSVISITLVRLTQNQVTLFRRVLVLPPRNQVRLQIMKSCPEAFLYLARDNCPPSNCWNLCLGSDLSMLAQSPKTCSPSSNTTPGPFFTIK